MDYIWLIRDSLSANNAIYFQFIIFVFSLKPSIFSQMMKDFHSSSYAPFVIYGTQIFPWGRQ